jgi:hypothetical protein
VATRIGYNAGREKLPRSLLPNIDFAPRRLLPALTDLARKAGEVIMRIYAEPFEVRGKVDKSCRS